MDRSRTAGCHTELHKFASKWIDEGSGSSLRHACCHSAHTTGNTWYGSSPRPSASWTSVQIGPLKSHLMRDTGLTSVAFASFLSALSILNTVTPLMSGALLPKLGVGRTAVMATSIVFVGQSIVLLGQATENYRFLPTLVGLAMFSCSFSPLLSTLR